MVGAFEHRGQRPAPARLGLATSTEDLLFLWFGALLGRPQTRQRRRVGGIRAIAAGGSHTLALVPSAALPPTGGATWGLNKNGQLGDGTTTQRTSPVGLTAL